MAVLQLMSPRHSDPLTVRLLKHVLLLSPPPPPPPLAVSSHASLSPGFGFYYPRLVSTCALTSVAVVCVAMDAMLRTLGLSHAWHRRMRRHEEPEYAERRTSDPEPLAPL